MSTPDSWQQEKQRKFVEGSIHREQSLFLEGAVLIFSGGATAFQTNFLNIWRDFTCLICIQRVVLRLRQRLLWHVLASLVAWQTARKDKYKRLREKWQWQGALLIFGGGSPYVECLQTAGETQSCQPASAHILIWGINEATKCFNLATIHTRNVTNLVKQRLHIK